jgi:hypothetical protein
MYTYNNSGEKIPTMTKNTRMKFVDNGSAVVEGYGLKSTTDKIILGVVIAIVVLIIGGIVYMYVKKHHSDSDASPQSIEMTPQSSVVSSSPLGFGGTNRYGFRFY